MLKVLFAFKCVDGVLDKMLKTVQCIVSEQWAKTTFLIWLAILRPY